MANLKYETRSKDASVAGIASVDMKLEVVVIPVSDVDRAKEFYRNLSWRLNADSFPMTPFDWPHSPCTL
jgi:hypothetical protein